MADTLLFRGGNTADINSAGTTVVDREIVIDTDTNEVVLGSSKKRLATQGNDVEFQNATFTGDITAGTYNDIRISRGGGSVSSNTAVGQSTLSVNTSGASNTAYGQYSLQDNDTGGYNTATGTYSMAENISGGTNVAVGYSALRSNTSGSANTANGYQSMYLNNGSNNTGLGYEALRFNADGGNNTAIGHRSLYTNTEGDKNTSIGKEALYKNATGNLNVSIGYESGYNIEGSNNTFIGAYKGSSADASLSSTVIISAGLSERARCDSAGTWQIGGTTAAPNLTLSKAGKVTGTSAEFGGDLTVGAGGSNNTTGIDVRAIGLIKASRPNANDALFVGYQNTGSGNQTSEIFANGDASFDGDITCANNSKGLILKSPDGTSFRLSVADDGTLSASSI